MNIRAAGLHGWQMVPTHTTSEMKTEITYSTGYDYHQAQGLWERLLSEAPLPPDQSIEAALLHAKADALREVAIMWRELERQNRSCGFETRGVAYGEAATHAEGKAYELRIQASGGAA